MNKTTQPRSKTSDTLKSRKAHLIKLSNIFESNSGDDTTQKLSIKAVKAELAYIEQKLKDLD